MKQQNKASLFLMELIVSILFFALASAICIQMFVKAKMINEESLLTHHAAITASSIAESYRSNQFSDLYQPNAHGDLYFQKTWNTISTSSTDYKVHVAEKDDTLSIQVYHKDTLVYTLQCQHYQQRNVKE